MQEIFRYKFEACKVSSYDYTITTKEITRKTEADMIEPEEESVNMNYMETVGKNESGTCEFIICYLKFTHFLVRTLEGKVIVESFDAKTGPDDMIIQSKNLSCCDPSRLRI